MLSQIFYDRKCSNHHELLASIHIGSQISHDCAGDNYPGPSNMILILHSASLIPWIALLIKRRHGWKKLYEEKHTSYSDREVNIMKSKTLYLLIIGSLSMTVFGELSSELIFLRSPLSSFILTSFVKLYFKQSPPRRLLRRRLLQSIEKTMQTQSWMLIRQRFQRVSSLIGISIRRRLGRNRRRRRVGSTRTPESWYGTARRVESDEKGKSLWIWNA